MTEHTEVICTKNGIKISKFSDEKRKKFLTMDKMCNNWNDWRVKVAVWLINKIRDKK